LLLLIAATAAIAAPAAALEDRHAEKLYEGFCSEWHFWQLIECSSPYSTEALAIELASTVISRLTPRQILSPLEGFSRTLTG